MKQGVFKYIFVLGFIILLIITYIVFYDKKETTTIQDQTSTVTTLITDLRLGVADFDTLNPIISKNKNVKEISRLIFDSLVTVGNHYNISFGLATEIAKSDDLTYIIKLRENVKWQDGTDFTSQDVKFTIDTIKNIGSPSYSDNLKYVTGLEIVDTYTIKIFLSESVEFFEYNLTFPILSASYFANEDMVNSEKNNLIIGTGMFKVDEKNDNTIKLSKNDTYWNKDKNSLLTEIDINLYNNIGEVYTAFKTGYIDIVDVTVNDIQTYIGSIGYNKIDYADRDVNFLCFNTQNELFFDGKTRRAIALLLDKNNIMANLGAGYVSTNFLIDSNNWMYDSKLNLNYNSEEADALLSEAGWKYVNNTWIKDGRILKFTIKVNGNRQDRIIVANIISEQLANHGIEVDVDEITNETYINDLNKKNYEVILTGMQVGYSPKVSLLFSDDNIANYSNDNVKNILSDIKNTSDYSIQKENYSKLYDEYLNDFPYIFLYRETDAVVYNQTLCGKITPNAYSVFYNIEKWYRQ